MRKPVAKKDEAQSIVQPAATIASHTEGVVEPDDAVAPTWRDYDPEGGMPLPGGERSQPEINGIFGSEELDADTGNYVLSVMYWRRMSGALIDVGLDFSPDRGVSRQQALRGLEYVRSLDPGFDEQAAGALWAEEEAERLRETLRERAVGLGLYKADEQEEESHQGTEWGRERTGESQLQRIREENEAKWEAEQAVKAAKAAEQERAELHSTRGPLELSAGVQPSVALTTTANGGVAISSGQTKAWLQPIERKPWVKYYEEQATIIKDNVVPHLSTLRRLAPSLFLALAVLAACLYVSDNYTPPPKSARMFPDVPPAVATLGAITAGLLATFVLSRLPVFWRANSKYFALVPAYPYAVSLVGASWRHDTLPHLGMNLLTLWLFGLALHEEVGRGTFLSIYIASGVAGGYASLVFNVLGKNWMTYIFGSSGSVLGVVGASCALRPNGTLRLFGYDLPLAAWMFVGVFGAAELIGLLRRGKTTIDHAGHLGGLASGVAAAMYLRRKAGEREDVMREVPAAEVREG